MAPMAAVAGRQFSRASLVAARRSLATAVSAHDFEAGEIAGIKYASLDGGKRACAITVALKAGPRYETTAGTAHLLKNSLFKRSTKRSYLRIARETEILGGVLSTGMDREHLYLTAEFARGDEDFFAEVLADALLLSPLIKHEYMEQGVPSTLNELKQIHALPEVLALDAAHQTAFRRGLGNSLFADPTKHVDYEVVDAYFRDRVSNPANYTVTASGIEPDHLKRLLTNYFDVKAAPSHSAPNAGSVTKPDPTAKFHGGETRLHRAGGRGAYVVGVPSGSSKDASWAVVANLLNPATSVKYGNGNGALSAKSAGKDVGLRADNYAYSDTGLLALSVDGPVDQLPSALSSAVGTFAAKDAAKDESVERAVNKTKADLAEVFDKSSTSLEHVARQLFIGGATSLSAALNEVDKVQKSAVTKAMSGLNKSAKVVVATGPLERMAYADELKL